jgi:hypothetical protein
MMKRKYQGRGPPAPQRKATLLVHFYSALVVYFYSAVDKTGSTMEPAARNYS